MPRGLRQVALSISYLSPIAKLPDAFSAMKIASLIFPTGNAPGFDLFPEVSHPSLIFGSSSLISRRRQSLSLSRAFPSSAKHQQTVAPSPYKNTRPRFRAILNTKAIPLRQTDDPLRLARVVAHEILNNAHTDGLL